MLLLLLIFLKDFILGIQKTSTTELYSRPQFGRFEKYDLHCNREYKTLKRVLGIGHFSSNRTVVHDVSVNYNPQKTCAPGVQGKNAFIML